MEKNNTRTGGESELNSNDLLACPHCGSDPKEQGGPTAAWISCSNFNDPCPSYDDGGEPMRVGGAMSIQTARKCWNATVKSFG